MAKKKMVTKEMEKKLPTFDELKRSINDNGGNMDNVTCYAKFFTPIPRHLLGVICDWHWYAVAYDPEQQLFYGIVDGIEIEWGDFSVQELEDVQLPHHLNVERDSAFTPMPMKDIQAYQDYQNGVRYDYPTYELSEKEMDQFIEIID